MGYYEPKEYFKEIAKQLQNISAAVHAMTTSTQSLSESFEQKLKAMTDRIQALENNKK